MEILAWWIYGSLILLTLLLAGGVVRVFLPPRLPKVREAACANCRYPVQGLGDWKCPECGTDLRVGGFSRRGFGIERGRGWRGGLFRGIVADGRGWVVHGAGDGVADGA
ncbi:MAG: hypothetical protein R3B46_00095 [Phycisphaerales bacterium]